MLFKNRNKSKTNTLFSSSILQSQDFFSEILDFDSRLNYKLEDKTKIGNLIVRVQSQESALDNEWTMPEERGTLV